MYVIFFIFFIMRRQNKFEKKSVEQVLFEMGY